MESEGIPRPVAISDEEKDNNPVFRAVYTKIRNLSKKLGQIEQIEVLDRKALKPAQLAKLARKEEVLREIAEQEEFVARYKALVLENNLIYDKVDDLIKISALLAVGSRVQRERFLPDEARPVCEDIFFEIVKGNSAPQGQLSDEIVRVYRLLEKYLSNYHYYSQCRDYMTYQEEIDARNPHRLDTLPEQQSIGHPHNPKM
jgi:hypothetical protein